MRKIIDLIKIKLNFKSFYVVIFAFSILVNLIVHLYLISSYGQIKPSPDAKLYLEIAYAIRHFSSSLFGIYNPDFAGEDIGYVIMPGYPLLISPLFENLQLIAIFQVILFSIGLYFLYKILQNKFLIIFVFITCIWIIISTSWPYHNVPLIESPTISILLILIYFLDKYFKDYQLKDFIWFSIIFGILIAINNRYIFHYCGLIPFLFFLKIFEKRIKFKHLLLSILIVTAIMAPWHIRQYIHYGEFVLFSPLRNETYKKAKERDEKMDTLIMVSKFKDYLMDSLNNPLKDDPKELEKCRLAWLERQKLYQRQAIDIAEKNKQNVSIEVTKKPSIIEPLKSKIGSEYIQRTNFNIFELQQQDSTLENAIIQSAKIIKIDTQLVIRKTIEQPSKISSNSQKPVIKTDSFIVVKKEFEVPEEIKIISNSQNISYYTIVNIRPSKYISLHSNKVKPIFIYNDGKIDIVIENFQVISLKVLDFSDNKEIRKFENMRIRKMVPAYDAIINALLKSHSNFGDTPEKLQKFLSDFSYEKYKQLVYEKFEPSNKFELFWNRFVDHFVFYRTDFELTPQWDPRIRWPSHYNNPVEMILDGIMLPLVLINIIPLIIALYKRDWFVVSLFVMVLLHIILHSLVAGVGDRGRYRLTIYPVWITFAVYGYDQIARWIIKKLKEKNITRAYFASFFSLIKK